MRCEFPLQRLAFSPSPLAFPSFSPLLSMSLQHFTPGGGRPCQATKPLVVLQLAWAPSKTTSVSRRWPHLMVQLPPPPFLSRDTAAFQTTPLPPMSAMPVRGATLNASRRFRPAARRRPPEARGDASATTTVVLAAPRGNGWVPTASTASATTRTVLAAPLRSLRPVQQLESVLGRMKP